MLGALTLGGSGLATLVSFGGWTWFNLAAAVGLLLVFGMAAYDKWRDERN